MPAGPWRVLRQTTTTAGAVTRDVLSEGEGDRDIARSMAGHDAGTVLAWELRGGKVPHLATATHTRADGAKVTYAVYPARTETLA
jgi:hypothetical protein